MVDLSGADLKAILAEDIRDDLRISGFDTQTNIIHGRRIQDRTYYRVATTDLLFEGARFRAFERARRVKRSFEIEAEGRLRASASGAPVSLRRFVLDELKRLRKGGTDEAYLRQLASMLDRDPPFEPLFTFRFDRPTVFGSFNRVTENRAFGTVNESRATSTNSSVIGTTTRFLLGVDLEKLGVDLGVLAAFSQRKLTIPRTGRTLAVEPADDLQFDLRIRRKFQGSEYWQPQPFVRTVFDTEFTPTVNLFTGETNPHQSLMRGESGVLFTPGRGWNKLELGAVLEQDIALGGLEAGVRLTAQYEKNFGAPRRLNYRFSNDLLYFFPAEGDDTTDLGITYQMIHEILIPLVDELSLSVAADIFVFRGKVPAIHELGVSAILRVGITYERLWKPFYQPFF